MDTFVFLIKPPDDEWKKMKAVYDSCKKAGLAPPREVSDFFEGDKPHPNGVRMNVKGHPAVRAIDEHHPESGFIVDVTKLPKDVKWVEVRNEW